MLRWGNIDYGGLIFKYIKKDIEDLKVWYNWNLIWKLIGKFDEILIIFFFLFVEEYYLFFKGLFIVNKIDICMLDIWVIMSLLYELICLFFNWEFVKFLVIFVVDKYLYYIDNGFLYLYDFLFNKFFFFMCVGKILGILK